MTRWQAGRKPRRAEIVFAVAWLALVASTSFGSVPFAMGSFLVLLAAPPHGGVDELIVIGAISSLLGACAGAITLLCYTISAMATRTPGARATWLRGAWRASRWLTRALWVMLACIVLSMVGIALRANFWQGTAELLLAVPVAGFVVVVTSVAQTRLRLIAARAARWARRYCLGCGYDLTGLDRCPECGRGRWERPSDQC